MIYTLIIVLFVAMGPPLTTSIVAPSYEDCQAARPLLEQHYDGQAVKQGNETTHVIDVETACVPFERRTKA